MTRTVDMVIAGGGRRAVAAAIEAINDGSRVLVVCRRAGAALERLRRQPAPGTLSVIEADVVCVDGVGAPEAVVLRDAKTGKLIGVNTSGLLWFTSPRAARPQTPASRSVESRRRRRARRSPSTAER